MIQVDKTRCPQNHKCPAVAVCPVNAIQQDGFHLPQINQNRCIECGKCIHFCPMRAIQKTN